MFQYGYWTLGRVRGIPVRLHWTLPVGALIFAGFSPIIWLAFAVIVLLHEAGHAALVRRYGFRVLAIDLTGFGGMCRWSGQATAHERGVIAWGGVLAQTVLLLITVGLLAVVGWPTSALGASLAYTFTRTNAAIIVLNLLPMPPFDGAEAWSLVVRYVRRFRAGSDHIHRHEG